jgi:hypothetical protein
METNARFDLATAIESWRQELAVQTDLTPDARRELETHLRDTVAELQRRSLNSEESFWLARRRVGQPKQLGEEFVKANPAKVWRERAFWAVVVLSLFKLWNELCPYMPGKGITIPGNVSDQEFLARMPFYLKHGTLLGISFPTFFYLLPVFCFVILFAKGWLNWVDRLFRFIFRSRLQFLLMGLASVLVFHYYDHTVGRLTVVPQSNLWFQYFTDVLFTKSWPLTLVVLIAWLMPVQNRKTPKQTQVQ